jgi:hypothetical protein
MATTKCLAPSVGSDFASCIQIFLFMLQRNLNTSRTESSSL